MEMVAMRPISSSTTMCRKVLPINIHIHSCHFLPSIFKLVWFAYVLFITRCSEFKSFYKPHGDLEIHICLSIRINTTTLRFQIKYLSV